MKCCSLWGIVLLLLVLSPPAAAIDRSSVAEQSPAVRAATLLKETQEKSTAQGAAEAEDSYRRAKELLQLADTPLERAKVLYCVVLLARLSGRTEEALAHLEEAESLRQEVPPMLRGLKSLLLFELGSTERSKQVSESRAQEATVDQEREVLELVTLLAEAQSRGVSEDRKVENLLEAAERMGVEGLVPMAELMKAPRGAQEQLAWSLNALTAIEEILGGTEQMPAVTRLFAALRAGQVEEVRAVEEQALLELEERSAEIFPDSRSRRSNQRVRALLLAQAGKTPQALILTREVVASIEAERQALRLDEFSLNLADDALPAFDELIQLELATEDRESAFTSSERARASTLLRWLGRPRPDPRKGGDPQLIGKLDSIEAQLNEHEKRRELVSGTERGELKRSIFKLRNERDDVLLSLKLRQGTYSELSEGQAQSLAEVQKALPEATTLVSFYTLADKTAAWVIDRESWQWVELKPTRADLDESVRAFRAALIAEPLQDPEISRARGRGFEILSAGEASPRALGQDLYRQLISPLAPHLRHPRLLLVPHEALGRLPWAALHDPETGQYLGQRFALSTLPAASAVLAHSQEPPTFDARSALVLGDPIASVSVLRPLPQARREAESVARRLGTTARTEAAATESALRAAAPLVTLLHLASHGVQEPGDPRGSYLALAADAHEDGRLEAREIFEEIRFDKRPLVVLSACQSGLGERAGGGETEGLVRAFLSAGARSVLATLWNIDDEASARLIDAFYQHLLAGEPTAQALRSAQAAMIADPKYGAPFFWAGFELTD